MFNVQILTTILQCDEVIAYAEEEIDDLQFRQTSAARQQTKTADQTAEVAEDLLQVQAEVDAFTAAGLALPADGPAKRENNRKLRRAIYNRENLLDQQGKSNPVAVLRRASEVEALGAQLAVYQNLKTEAAARKGEL